MIIKCTTQVWAGFWWYHQDGYFRRGRRIAVNARSAGQRRGKVSKGKQKILQGRPKGMRIASFPDVNEMQPKGKTKHSLQKSIINGTQNAGK